MSPDIELIKSLARAMLMADLMSCRLAAAYRERDDAEAAEEMVAALEAENAALRRGLLAAQDRVLDVQGAA